MAENEKICPKCGKGNLQIYDRAGEHYRTAASIFHFGDWITTEIIQAVIRITRIAPQHTYLFLTKNPARLQEFNPWPDNCWVGVTATDALDFATAVVCLGDVKANVKFLSMEPLLAWGDYPASQIAIEQWAKGLRLYGITWLILGGLTGFGGSKSYPLPEWVAEIEDAADRAGVKVWEKENLRASHPTVPYRQEWPTLSR